MEEVVPLWDTRKASPRGHTRGVTCSHRMVGPSRGDPNMNSSTGLRHQICKIWKIKAKGNIMYCLGQRKSSKTVCFYVSHSRSGLEVKDALRIQESPYMVLIILNNSRYALVSHHVPHLPPTYLPPPTSKKVFALLARLEAKSSTLSHPSYFTRGLHEESGAFLGF